MFDFEGFVRNLFQDNLFSCALRQRNSVDSVRTDMRSSIHVPGIPEPGQVGPRRSKRPGPYKEVLRATTSLALASWASRKQR